MQLFIYLFITSLICSFYPLSYYSIYLDMLSNSPTNTLNLSSSSRTATQDKVDSHIIVEKQKVSSFLFLKFSNDIIIFESSYICDLILIFKLQIIAI